MIASRERGEPLVLVGCGGFGRETAELVNSINETAGAPRWAALGFIDDNPELDGHVVSGLPVLGGLDRLAELSDARVVVCTGRPEDFGSKRRIVDRLGFEPERYATLVHPTAVLPRSCSVGHGSVLLAGVVATTDVRIGRHAAVMPQSVFTHDDVLEDFVTVGAGTCLAGNVRVGAGAYLGAGCRVRENLTIGARALVGMGAVVVEDVPDDEVWAGVPARRLAAVGAAR